MRTISVLKFLTVLLLCSPPALPGRTVPPLTDLLAASELLAAGDIPGDLSTAAGKTPLYVDPAGDDANSGLTPAAPKRRLGAAIAYANSRPQEPFVIYLRGGVHYRPAEDEYLAIERGELMIASYPGEEATVRPHFYPADPTSWGEEVFLYSRGPYENITIRDLTLQGWSVPLIFGSPFEGPPMRNLVIKDIRADDFRRRGPGFITSFFSTDYLLTGYFAGRQFDPDDPGIKYQIEGLILSGIRLSGVDMPVNIGDEDDANVRGLRISDVEVRNEPAGSGSTAVDGFALVNCHRVLIDNCVLENIEGDGIDAKSTRVAVINTLLSRIGRNGVKFWRDGEVINTIIYAANADAAFVIEAGPCRMIHSILALKGDGYAGTYAYGIGSGEKFAVINSILIDLDHTFYLGTPDLRSLNSLYFNLPAGLYSGEVEVSTVGALNGLAGCGGNLEADPRLIDPAGGDFRAAYGSPGRGRGTAAGSFLPSFDYFGNPRRPAAGRAIGPVEPPEPFFPAPIDLDGDGTSDPLVFRDLSGLWAVRGKTRLYFGGPGDIPAPADYTGNGKAEIAVFRRPAGLWAVRGWSRWYFGNINDLPLPMDIDGSGSALPVVFRESTGRWAVRGLTRFYFGRPGDRPVPGDYAGNGNPEFAVFRESSGLWAVRGLTRFYFGRPGDRPVPGDYDGDGKLDFAVFRESSGLWAVRGQTRWYFGRAGDRPVPVGSGGGGKTIPGIFREATGLWARRGVSRWYFGRAGDFPAAR